MIKIYINIDLNLEKIIFKYKNKIVLIINVKETCPSKNISHN